MDMDRLWTEHAPALYAAGRRMARHALEADDLVQHALVKAIEHWDELVEYHSAHLRAWLLRTMRNKLIDLRRAQRRIVDEAQAPEIGYEADDSQLYVGALLEGLPEADCELIRLRYCVGLNSVEIGRQCGLAPPTVRTRLRSALRRLRATEREDE